MKPLTFAAALLLTPLVVVAQHHHEGSHENHGIVENVEAQPLLAHALRINEALSFIGSAIPQDAQEKLNALKSKPLDKETVTTIQQILDPYCLAHVDINPESRVKAEQGAARPVLIQEGWATFLLKVHNQAHITAKLVTESPNAQPVLHGSTSAPRMKPENALTPGQLDNRFLEIIPYHGRPLKPNLSGLGLEYVVVQLYTRASGKKEAKLGFNVGHGTQDIGFRNTIDILFNIRPAVKVILDVKDEDNSSAIASFIITDRLERFRNVEAGTELPGDYRLARAMQRHWEGSMRNKVTNSDLPYDLPEENKLNGIYPLPSRRIATRDEYPDFFFQPQVYRADGEHVYLPPGKYYVTYARGPEYKELYREIVVPDGKDSITVNFRLERWIHMAALGWYSADHHIHAAGCAHYESPEEGVLPEHMWRQVKGEDLNMGSNLTWGPSWYYQKQFFTGVNHPLSNKDNILRYDIEVSGFPSSHAGHIVLLNLKEDDYPNTTTIEDWPSWTLPVLKWAKAQGGLTGYAHSGWGLAPMKPTNDYPNYVMPKMDGIGANEYVVTVTHDVIDFFSAGDTPLVYELNMWYHTLNCGFRTRISGETDFPCISDERVGAGRVYAKLDKGLDFVAYMDAIKRGRTYVSDGYSHLIDFKVNDVKLGESDSELKVRSNTTLNASVRVAAYLTEKQDAVGSIIASRSPTDAPWWHIERARKGTSRKIPVELVVNGFAVAQQEVTADGSWQDVTFSYRIPKSAWVAVRIPSSAHTNPIFVIVDNKPILDKKSAAWCREAVDQCWKMKKGEIRAAEQVAARDAYDHARKVYDRMIATKD